MERCCGVWLNLVEGKGNLNIQRLTFWRTSQSLLLGHSEPGKGAPPNRSLSLHPLAVTSKLFPKSTATQWHDTMLHTGKYRDMIADHTCGEGHQRQNGNMSDVDGDATLPPPNTDTAMQSIRGGQMHDPIPWLHS